MPYEVSVEFSTTSGCIGGSDCIDFSDFDPVYLIDATAVPAGKRLVIQWVSANLGANDGFDSISLQSSPIIANQNVKWQYHGPFFQTSSSANLFGMRSGAFATYGSGESPHLRVLIENPNGIVRSIAIAGYLIDES